MPLSRGRSNHRPRGLFRLGRASLVTELAADRGPFPLGCPQAPGAGVQGQGRLHPEVAAPLSSPWAFPRPGSGPRPPRPSGSPKPSPRDSQRLLTTQHPAREPGLGRRSCHSHHPVTGFRSVTTAAATALFLRLFGDPPTSLTTNEKRGRQETTVRWPAQALPRRKAKLLSGLEWRGRGKSGISKLLKAWATSGHLGPSS